MSCCATHTSLAEEKSLTDMTAHPLARPPSWQRSYLLLVCQGLVLRCLHTPAGWPLVSLPAWPYVQAIQSQPARQNEQKITPIYLQVFVLTWPNASALSRGGMSGRKSWVQEALVWAAASPGERRHLGQMEQSPWARFSSSQVFQHLQTHH